MMQNLSYKKWRPLPNSKNQPDNLFFTPEFEHKISIQQGDSIFTIGSCFARNIEAFLRSYYKVPSYIHPNEVPKNILATNSNVSENKVLWHRYNVFSILNSIKWSLEPEKYSDCLRLMLVNGNSYVDPYAGCRDILPQSNAKQMVQWIDGVFNSIRQCRLIIITLGLSEVWQDLETGLVLNCSPLKEMWEAYPGRFKNRLASFSETIEELEEINNILKRNCLRDFNIIVSVSPIPLSATFQDVDIAVANTASKAILRAAAEEWTNRHENVHYFPSYEIILGSASEVVWTEDFRHPTINAIRHVMSIFLNNFTDMIPS